MLSAKAAKLIADSYPGKGDWRVALAANIFLHERSRKENCAFLHEALKWWFTHLNGPKKLHFTRTEMIGYAVITPKQLQKKVNETWYTHVRLKFGNVNKIVDQSRYSDIYARMYLRENYSLVNNRAYYSKIKC